MKLEDMLWHKAQFRRWMIKPVTAQVYAEVRAAMRHDLIDEFVGFAFVKTSLLP